MYPDILWLQILTGLTIGLIFGSFVTMLSYRLPQGLSIIMPPSHCPQCQARLTPRDLIPVISWLMGRGRCRHCGARISARYPAIELATAIAVTLAFVGIGFSWWLLPILLVIIATVTTVTIWLEQMQPIAHNPKIIGDYFRHSVFPALGQSGSRQRSAWRLALLLMLIVPPLFGLLALALGQDANWDLRNYHWYNAYAFMNGRYLIDLLPSQTPFFYNPTIDVPFYLLASHVQAMTASFVLGTVQGLNFVLLFMLAHAALTVPNHRNKVLVCAALAALGMLGGGGIAQIGTSFYDNVTSLGILLSALLVVRNFASLMTSRLIRAGGVAMLCGIPAGLAMGCKLPVVVFCIGLCIALLLVRGTPLRRLWAAFMLGIGIMAGIALSMGHWAWFLYAHFGSPMFPYFNGFFASPLAPLSSARDTQFIPAGMIETLLLPFRFADNPRLVGEIDWSDIRIPLLYAILPLAALARLAFGRNVGSSALVAAPVVGRYLLWVGIIAYTVWLPLFSIYRYLLPLEMLAPLLIVLAVGMLPLAVRTRALLAAILLLAVAVSVRAGDWNRLPHWLDSAVEAEVPAIAAPEKVMVLMTGFEPYSHVLTALPPAATFVRIQSNFSSPNEEKGINGLMRQKLDLHISNGGRFMLLAPNWHRDMSNQALGYFGLTLLPTTCQPVVDNLYDSKLELCSVK